MEREHHSGQVQGPHAAQQLSLTLPSPSCVSSRALVQQTASLAHSASRWQKYTRNRKNKDQQKQAPERRAVLGTGGAAGQRSHGGAETRAAERPAGRLCAGRGVCRQGLPVRYSSSCSQAALCLFLFCCNIFWFWQAFESIHWAEAQTQTALNPVVPQPL